MSNWYTDLNSNFSDSDTVIFQNHFGNLFNVIVSCDKSPGREYTSIEGGLTYDRRDKFDHLHAGQRSLHNWNVKSAKCSVFTANVEYTSQDLPHS